MTNALRAGLIAAALAASMACSSNTTAPSDLKSASSTQATFSVAVRPSPITATRCNPQCPDESGTKTFAFSADMTIDTQDSASVGATINSITLTATAASTTFAPLVLSGDDIKLHAGTNHVNGQATLSVPISLLYNTPAGTANLDVAISVQGSDDRNNPVTASGQVSIR